MAETISLILAAVLIAGMTSYSRYIFRRLGPVSSMPWPRGWRLAFFWLALIATVAILIPGVALGVWYVLGMAECPAQLLPGEPWKCSANGRLAIVLGALVVMMPLGGLWLRFLRQKTLGFR
jgi:hypothetical protein